MRKINLKDFYSYYKKDEFVEVSDEVFDLLCSSEREESAYILRTYRHKAYYSLDLEDGIEYAAIETLSQASVDEISEKIRINKMLYNGIASLPKKQKKRLYAYYFLEMSIPDIARSEGVNKSQITRSIDKALHNLRLFLEKVL